MALTDKERESIIEEERVRWETRRLLMQEAWAHGGPCGAHGRGHWGRRLLGSLLFLGGLAWLITALACRF